MCADGDTVDKHLALPIDSAEMQNAALIIKAAVESEPLSVPKALVWLKRALNAGKLALDGERQDYLAAEIFRAGVARWGYLIIALAVEAHPILAHKLWAGILRKRAVFVHIVKESGFQIVHLLNLRNLIKSHIVLYINLCVLSIDLFSVPLHALGGILEDDAHFLELISDSVRLCPVFLLTSVRARLNKSFNIAVESLGLAVIDESEHTGQLVEHGYRAFDECLRGGLADNICIDIADELKYRSDGVGGVEIVVHRRDKLLSVFIKSVDNRLIAVMLCVGSVLELEVERIAAGIEPVERGDALFDDIGAVVYRASVLGGDEQIADRLIAVFSATSRTVKKLPRDFDIFTLSTLM